jgi:hypothetical protein
VKPSVSRLARSAAPNASACAEWFVLSIKERCLDGMILFGVFGECHLHCTLDHWQFRAVSPE